MFPNDIVRCMYITVMLISMIVGFYRNHHFSRKSTKHISTARIPIWLNPSSHLRNMSIKEVIWQYLERKIQFHLSLKFTNINWDAILVAMKEYGAFHDFQYLDENLQLFIRLYDLKFTSSYTSQQKMCMYERCYHP